MNPPRAFLCLAALATYATAHDWINWRGPYQNGASAEHYQNGELQETPAWTYDSSGRGTPIIFDGKLLSFGYRGVNQDLVELLTCLHATTGEKLWEIELQDFLSDTVYNRYSIGSPTVDPDTRRVYLLTAYGIFLCAELDTGKIIWEKSMMEDFGRMTFPNSKTGAPVIDGNKIIIRGITANWGSEGPAADRFYAFDKVSGELIWSSTPGTIPPVDSSFSQPVIETRNGRRIMYVGTGCGHIVCINIGDGQPLWTFKLSHGGVNAAPIIVGDTIIGTHGDGNIDSSDSGRTTAIKLPTNWPSTPPLTLGRESEAWRTNQSSPTSSPTLYGDRLFIHGPTGILSCLNANTGQTQWNLKLTQTNVHASPLIIDNLIYVPILVEGSSETTPENQGNGALAIVKPGTTSGEILKRIKLEGQCLGSPAVANGLLYIHTTKHLYAFPIKHNGITLDPIPQPTPPVPGPATALQIIPAETALNPGSQQKFTVLTLDAVGLPTGGTVIPTWQSFIPPTAKVKATMDATFNNQGDLTTTPEAKPSAGAFKATHDTLTGVIRGRVLPSLPITINFEDATLIQPSSGTTARPFDYPPLPWIGARFKFEIQELNGQKVIGKTLDRILFQRGYAFIGTSDMNNYTMSADLMTDGNRRTKSDVGLINQRYLFALKGNPNLLEISSNYDRFRHSVPFTIQPNVWYTMTTRVDVAPDGSGNIRAKVWPRGEAEPAAWTIDIPTSRTHKNGSPGIYSFVPQSLKQAFLDNIKVTPN